MTAQSAGLERKTYTLWLGEDTGHSVYVISYRELSVQGVMTVAHHRLFLPLTTLAQPKPEGDADQTHQEQHHGDCWQQNVAVTNVHV